MWDLESDEWWADGPVLLDFDGEQVEINHQKFDDLSVTWNTVDTSRPLRWGDGSDELGWRRGVPPALAALRGQTLRGVELLERAGGDVADETVAVSFEFPDSQVTVCNNLDENGLEFGSPQPERRRQP